MEFATLIPIFVALFVIIDPIGLAPLFVALTRGMGLEFRENGINLGHNKRAHVGQ